MPARLGGLRPGVARVATRQPCQCQRRHIINQYKPSYAQSQQNKDFFLTILAATATKRDARAYLERYQKPYLRPKSIRVKDSSTLSHFQHAEDGELLDAVPSITSQSPIRVALVGVRESATLTDAQIRRIVNTLGQLLRLGLQPVVVLDSPKKRGGRVMDTRPADRVCRMLEQADIEARPVYDGLFRCDGVDTDRLRIHDTRTLKAPTIRQQIPVVQCLGVDSDNRRARVLLDDAMAALCRAFGLAPETVPFQADFGRSAFIIDKIILLDRIGGIPSPARKAGSSHVFINLDQENLELQKELISGCAEPLAAAHLRNLELCRICLDLLAESSSAVVTTPDLAGSTAGEPHPLIHNLLTDKPMFSPSLPVKGRRTPSTSTTILRKGLAVTVHRDVSLRELDLEKLQHLIADSFGRRLDLQKYLDRIERGVAAAVIIAGDYEGAAIVTYESPLSASHSTSCGPVGGGKSGGDGGRPAVVYLDKFAVLRARQGAGGVADVLFNSLTRTFPAELVWRSREENPVNKWYFERASGTLLVEQDADPSPATSLTSSNDADTAAQLAGDAIADAVPSKTAETQRKVNKWRLFWRSPPAPSTSTSNAASSAGPAPGVRSGNAAATVGRTSAYADLLRPRTAPSSERLLDYISITRKIRPTWLD